MLQKNTGILFGNGVGHENPIHSVIYSNVGKMDNEVKTMAGDLYLMGNQDFPSALAYNFIERIEKSSSKKVERPKINELLEEFSVLATFGLHAIFSPEREMVRILTDKQAQSYREQDKLVHRVFDSHITLEEAEIHDFTKLVEDFLTLERNTYDTAKKSINRYAVAIRNIPENPTTAFTMLVSVIDVLVPVDYSIPKKHKGKKQKRSRTKNKQKQKIPNKQNFIKFLNDQVDIDELASELPMLEHPIRHLELLKLMDDAYSVRSDFIHSAALLKEELKSQSNFVEYMKIDGKYHLTLQGLIRIVRHVIKNFIRNGKKVDIAKQNVDQYDNSEAGEDPIMLPGENKEPEKPNYRPQFNSMLEQYTKYVLGSTDIAVEDLRPLLFEIEKTIDAATDNDKMTMFAIHTLYNRIVSEEERSKDHKKFFEKFKHLMAKSYPEILIIRTITGNHDWSLDAHQLALNEYKNIRLEENEVVGGPMFESAIYLDFAERHRKENISDSKKTSEELVKIYIRRAVRLYPNHPKLRQFEKEYDGVKPIDWVKILVVKDNDGEATSKSVE